LTLIYKIKQMSKLMKPYFALVLFCISATSYAQFPGASGRGQNMNMGHFYGKILDAASGKAIDAASIQLIQNKMDTVTKTRKDVIVAGMLTDKKGEFSLENLSVMASYKLKVSAIGYKEIEQKVAFEINMNAAKNGDFSSMLKGVDKDLGNIKLEVDIQQLSNVTVSASSPLLQMSIDRKIFNVEKNLTSVGGTAIDVMRNVPSINVDIDGNVTLRNAPPQIFVDGRPSTLTLEQIPADAIATVELITNPSAKFDASGGGSGILNIVLKKNRKAGYNGSVRANLDSRLRPGLGGDFNVKQQKVNFFANAQMGMRKSISTVNSIRTDFLDTGIVHLNQNNNPINRGYFAFGRLGMDYFIDNRNTLTIGGNIVRGEFKTDDEINIFRDTVFKLPQPDAADKGIRNSKNDGTFKNYGASLSFKHNFTKPDKELTVDVNYNYSKNDNVGDFNTQYYFTNNAPKAPRAIEQSKGGGTSGFFTAQTDFVNPISKNSKMEMGLRAALRTFTSFNDNYIKNNQDQYILIPGLSNNYKFNDAVYAAYTTYSQQIKDFSFQLGLRVESSEYNGTLITQNQKFENKFPFSLFPSTFLSYKLTGKQDVQLNYSRKINRPNFFQLIPFIDYTDSLNLTKGNPSLTPEFTNLIELSYQNQYKANNSFLASIYFRNTENLITRFQYRDINPNPGKTDSVIISTYANADKSYTYGLELTGKNKIAKWWEVTTSINLFNSALEAGNLVGGVDNSLFSWFVKS
jgi:outer membrane receptor protein involved in Fe transport